MEFYKCSVCGKIIAVVNPKNVPTMCCGKVMEKMIPNTQDGVREKHIPVVTVNGNKVTVTVGEVNHPMMDAHYIMWIAIHTDKGNQRKELKPGEEPKAVFYIGEGERVLEVLEYCNLHGLYSKAL